MLNYVLREELGFQIPSDAMQLDPSPDGRIYLAGISKLWRETAAESREFEEISAPDFGAPAFLRISPNGSNAAIGNYGERVIYIFDLPYTSVSTVEATSYDAEWLDEQLLAVSNQGDSLEPPSEVLVVDAAAASATTVITEIPGYSGGVTFDEDGNLLTGIGAAERTGPATGLVRRFHREAWQHALTRRVPLEFSDSEVDVVNLLSAAFLTFDRERNLCLGGGAGIGPAGNADTGYVGVVSRDALDGDPTVEPTADASVLQRLDPTPSQDNEYWTVNANTTTGEIYLKLYGSDAVLVYRQ